MQETRIDKSSIAYAALVALFTGSLVSSNYLASKIFTATILGVSVAAPAAVLAYAMTFLFTDIISEIYGRKPAGIAVLVGFATQLLILAYNSFALALPHAPFSPATPEAYKTVVGGSAPIILASLTAYIISQTHDVWAFHFWKKRTQGRWLWLRNNASTMVSQLIDTVIFITLAFHIIPSILGLQALPWDAVKSIVIGQYIVKWLIALGDTPFVYLGSHLVSNYIGVKTIGVTGLYNGRGEKKPTNTL